jgi:molecular chaperone DnaJ
MARDYYLILGVGSDATPDQIKSAYRREAKRLHPDHSGEGSEPFLAIQEAYEVLGDPGRRRAYDEAQDREKRAQQAARGAHPESLRGRCCPVEPLIPTQRSSGSSAPFQAWPLPSAVEAQFRRRERDWDGLILPAARRREAGEIHVQVALTQEQALQGGRIRIWVPLEIRCPACGGRGGLGFYECPHCYGSGAAADEYPVDVAFPGGVAHGAEGQVSVGRPGMRDLALVLHFSVREW